MTSQPANSYVPGPRPLEPRVVRGRLTRLPPREGGVHGGAQEAAKRARVPL